MIEVANAPNCSWLKPILPKIGVSIGPGLIALTRILRPLRSEVHDRANERTAALLALYTLNPSMPFRPAMEEFKMIEPPSLTRASAFCTLKSNPFDVDAELPVAMLLTHRSQSRHLDHSRF